MPPPSTLGDTPPRVLHPNIPFTPQDVTMALKRIAGFLDNPIACCLVTAGVETADAIRLTVQVKDRLVDDFRPPTPSTHLVFLWFSETPVGPPSAVGSVAWVQGDPIAVLTADAVFIATSDEDGLIVLDASLSGTESRYLNTLVLGRADPGTIVSWVDAPVGAGSWDFSVGNSEHAALVWD